MNKTSTPKCMDGKNQSKSIGSLWTNLLTTLNNVNVKLQDDWISAFDIEHEWRWCWLTNYRICFRMLLFALRKHGTSIKCYFFLDYSYFEKLSWYYKKKIDWHSSCAALYIVLSYLKSLFIFGIKLSDSNDDWDVNVKTLQMCFSFWRKFLIEH